MRQYELMVIIQGDAGDEGVATLVDTIRGWIEGQNGNIVRIDNWGRRHLAYPINKQREGYYVLFTVDLLTAAVTELERNLRISEDVLRYLTVRLDE